MASIDLGTVLSFLLVFAIPITLTIALLYGQLLDRRSRSIKRLVPKPVVQSAPNQAKADEFRKLGPLRSFYYLDERHLADLYPMVSPRQPTRVETTESRQSEKSLSGKAPIAAGVYGRSSSQETKQVFEVSHERAVMYNEVDKYLLDHDRITFGLETFDYDKSRITEFENLRDQMIQKCDFPIPEDVQKSFISKTMVEFAARKIENIAGSSGFVAIIAEVASTSTSDGYSLTLDHPLNQYLTENEPRVLIRIHCPIEGGVTPLGASFFKQAVQIKIACLGKVVAWDVQHRVLEINPIAIF